MPYQPNGQKLPATPWLCAYWPVMKVAREGQQSGNESTASANVVPFAASRRLTFGMCARSACAWSSVITTRMFGRPSLRGRGGARLRGGGQGENGQGGPGQLRSCLASGGERTVCVTQCQLLYDAATMAAEGTQVAAPAGRRPRPG